MNLFLKTILPFFLIFLLIHCEDPIDLKIRREGGILVVNGKISTLPGPYKLSLGYTSSDERTPLPESGAQIFIFDNDGNSELYSEINPGVYQLSGNTVTGSPGKSYFIEIQLVDGKTYSSAPELLPEATGVDSSYFEFYQKTEFVNGSQIKKNVIGIYTDTRLAESSTRPFLRWDVEEIYMFEQTPVFNPLTGGIPLPCFITGYPDPQRITLFTSNLKQGQKLQRTLVAEREIDYTFLARHYFIVNLSSISDQAYLYWDQVNGLINKSGSIFDTPPAPVKGNLYNVDDPAEQVLGFFEASNTTVSRTFTIRSYVPFPVPFNCYTPDKGLYSPDYPKSCYDCLLEPNSSHEKPDWF